MAWCWLNKRFAYRTCKSKAVRTKPRRIEDLLRNIVAGDGLRWFLTVPLGHWSAVGTLLLCDALYLGGYLAFRSTYIQIWHRVQLIGMAVYFMT